jgi:hypothetical protein
MKVLEHRGDDDVRSIRGAAYARAVYDYEQHDNHCWISFAGENYTITAMRGVEFMLLERQPIIGERRPHTAVPLVCDLSGVEWDAYVFAARVMLGITG